MDTTINDLGPMEKPAIQDRECEDFVLASLLSYPSTFEDVKEFLDQECFLDVKNREVFHAYREVYFRGHIPDFILVSEQLARCDSNITQLEVLNYLQGSCTPCTLTSHALRLKELALRRRLWEIGVNLVTKGVGESDTVEEIHNEAKSALDALYDSNYGNRFVSLADTYVNELQQQMLVNRSLTEGKVFGTSTGFRDIDIRGGLVGGSLNIVGAETSMGKTSFANALTLSAIRQGHGVAYYSMEMQPRELNARFVAMLTGISGNRILYDRMEMPEIYRCDAAMDSIDGSLLHFDGRSTSSLESILMSVRSMHAKFNIKGVVVDYLQLIAVGDKSMNREQTVAKIARDLKNLAKELDIWVIALSQLARDKNNPVPNMARLRDSGQIEEAADNVFLLYRILDNKSKYPEPFTEAPTSGTAMIIIGKGRNTGTGQFLCAFNPATTLFRPLQDNELDNLRTQNNDDPFNQADSSPKHNDPF